MAKRVDANQPAIVAALRQAGCTVQVLSAVGKGCPDLLVSYHGLLFMCEVKDGGKSPSKQRLTPDEADWHEKWRESAVLILNDVERIPRMLTMVVRHYEVALGVGDG